MDDREFEKILASAEFLRRCEQSAPSWTDNYSDMNSMEKSMLLDEVFALLKTEKSEKEQFMAKLERMTEQLLALTESSQAQAKANEKLSKVIDELKKMLLERDALIEKLRKENASLKEQKKLSDKNRFAGKTQKLSSKSRVSGSRESDKEDYDGTSTPDLPSDGTETDVSSPAAGKQERPYRQGMSYKRMKADKSVRHDFDFSRLPKDAVIIKTFYKYSYEQVSYIQEHRYQVVRYKLADGKIRESYLSKDGGPDYIDVVPGTHASADFLAHLAFNHFVLNVPYYREMYRLSDHGMSLSRMTLINWLEKGARFTKGLVETLKNMAMEKDSIVNCDETWCKVKVRDTYRKRYLWCLVNREERIVIYCYEDGSRSREALKCIIGDRQIKALQSDGYNVYMYLDDRLYNTEHLCCMAHARAKFVYAYEQGGDLNAKRMLEYIGWLYGEEECYRLSGLSSEEITQRRNSLRTKEIIGRMRSFLNVLTSEEHPPRGDLMEKAVNYLKKFWNQIFAYLKDGRYSIDNSIAERFIRPLAGERKNSLFFGSNRMANVSAAYHTLISTCRANGISALAYLKKLFCEVVKGRSDYENLLPMTIGSCTNKL